MCKFHICGSRHIQLKNGHATINKRGLAMFLSSCKLQSKKSRDRPLLDKGFGHVFSSNVLTDERVIHIHVSSSFVMDTKERYL